MVETLEDTSGKVFCGIFSPDGNTFLTASQGNHHTTLQFQLKNTKNFQIVTLSYTTQKTVPIKWLKMSKPAMLAGV